MLEESAKARRVVDLFAGSGAVASYVARQTKVPVLAVDLQQYSRVLAAAIISRDKSYELTDLLKIWLEPVLKERGAFEKWKDEEKRFKALDGRKVRQYVDRCRSACKNDLEIGPIWSAYGGYYYSPQQAITFDLLLKHLPKDVNQRVICQAAMIMAASRCAASPGHTAQPFQPTPTARKFILESWSKDPIEVCKTSLAEICPQFALCVGEARVGDAVSEAANLRRGDLVFVDPPYSGVHYSRFYHVLETLAKGSVGAVDGAGRYASVEERPQSDFSLSGKSEKALEKLFDNLSMNEVSVIFTFPEGKCSNGLSGDMVLEKARKSFRVEEALVKEGKFSTLGGNKRKRASRVVSRELVILMRSK